MKDFAELYNTLDETTSTNRKIDAMAHYFRRAPEEDAIWTISFLIGRKPRQVVPTRKLMQWAAELAEVPEWLFEASYDVVGDLAETITLLLPDDTNTSERPLHEWVELELLPLRQMEPDDRRPEILSAWNWMDQSQRFVWNKLITGGFRVGVSRRLVVRTLERFSGVDAADAVLIYAQRGHGRRAGLYTDYTFAVYQGDTLVPFAKAYSGLSDKDIREVDRFIQRNTLERFGPVRSVRPELVFEIAFEGIQESSRHKSGLAVRFPRIARWRRDKKIEEIDTIERITSLLSSPSPHPCP